MTGKTVFVTGGSGYIGSHSVVELLNDGHNVIAIDNFSNSVSGKDDCSTALKRVEKITKKSITFLKCDLLDAPRLKKIFQQHKIDVVIHFAAMKAVGESMKIPLTYYKNNIIGTINLIEAMKSVECYQLVFSSSCCVYGDPEFLPITEDHPTGNVTNVYGRTKYFIEEMLKDLSNSDEKWNIISLRYFNPVGAHPSGEIGEDPLGIPNNLMPYIGQVAIGKLPYVTVFGNDYDTVDGTGVRDYIHVMDLAAGHVAALKKLFENHLFYRNYNLGIGNGISVLQLIKTFEAANGVEIKYKMSSRRYGDVPTLICDSTQAQEELKWSAKLELNQMCSGVSVLELIHIFGQLTNCAIPYKFEDRREGDIVSMYANANLASEELNWVAKLGHVRMCEDFWRWLQMNPNGYRDGSGNEKNDQLSVPALMEKITISIPSSTELGKSEKKQNESG